MNMAETIKSKLEQKLSVKMVEVIDESYKHEGHAGARPGGQTHFAVLVVSEEFTGKGRVERQRMVFAILKEELDGPVHALRFVGAHTPAEYSEITG